ncbi:3'-phosphoinositide-dependent protein kinase 1 [Striga asiatica]|uniref:3'-phosphoinositide-dependent protein kinase 1 n=1 Tax=Striga asiatica TaxID=4170 RepID=A0A5A7Q174_STRAF|nr:3'-phosphoinositide-dependent protein kinase 1 [Striga asiatica]
MALAGSLSRIFCSTPQGAPCIRTMLLRPPLNPLSPPRRASNFTVSAKVSRTGKFDSKNRRNSPFTTTKEEEEEKEGSLGEEVNGADEFGAAAVDDGFVVPELPGDKPDFWEGPQWDALGFFVQYMWAFGVVFAVSSVIKDSGHYERLYERKYDASGGKWIAKTFEKKFISAKAAEALILVTKLVACGVAVATYNEGATDFKETPAYKEAIQSRDLDELDDAATSDVFESNPTEEAPSLE